ncbi:putative Bile salt-activated lipase [Rosellinia necatrix]|uniref:Putative Bile salt-activated lipase n=1 Tax=Rosellinia necatrix TaxID=77044 RepID=A0A1S7UL55_ROSNE|nr:putative Bile salt-activated lipase [Rosellinia necatrix]
MFSTTENFGSFGHSDSQWSTNSSWSVNQGDFSQAAYNGSSTFGVINELKFLAAKSSRQSTIILAAFNIVSAAATAAGIFYNGYLSVKRSPLRRKQRVNIFTCVRGPDLYPFVLSLGIVGQGVIFVASQAQGLDSLFQTGCALISQFMWPAIFIVPYLQLVFSVETTLRALKSNPFPPRSKWTVAICLTIVKIALLATGLITFFIRAPNVCFAALFWFVAKWAEIGFALLIAIVVIMVTCAVIIYLKLTRYSMIEDDERIGASRMIYYIALAVIPNTLMIPFFGYLSFGNPFENGGDTGLTLSMVSTVVANVTGLMTGGLYLFLRSSTISSIAPKNKLDEYERQQIKYQIRMPKANGTDFNNQIMKPVMVPQWLREIEPQEKQPTLKDIGHMDDKNAASIRSADNSNPLGLNFVFNPMAPRSPVKTQTPLPMAPVRTASSSYGLFPNKFQTNRTSKAILPSTIYSQDANESVTVLKDCCDMLVPPPSMQPMGSRHRRDSSMGSSATVQIGLRLSNVEDVRPITVSTIGGIERTHELGCPNKPKADNPNRPSPLMTIDSTVSSPRRPFGVNQLDTAMKTLPPVPQDPYPEMEIAPITLNPTVYSPSSPTKGKVPSPKGVGFNVPARTNTTPIEIVEANTPPPRLHGNSPTGPHDSADWI